MENNPGEGDELRLIRAQLESLARQQKQQIDIFKKATDDIREIRVAAVIMVIIFLLALMVYVYSAQVFR